MTIPSTAHRITELLFYSITYPWRTTYQSFNFTRLMSSVAPLVLITALLLRIYSCAYNLFVFNIQVIKELSPPCYNCSSLLLHSTIILAKYRMHNPLPPRMLSEHPYAPPLDLCSSLWLNLLCKSEKIYDAERFYFSYRCNYRMYVWILI